jgi:hypothetical protein
MVGEFPNEVLKRLKSVFQFRLDDNISVSKFNFLITIRIYTASYENVPLCKLSGLDINSSYNYEIYHIINQFNGRKYDIREEELALAWRPVMLICAPTTIVPCVILHPELICRSSWQTLGNVKVRITLTQTVSELTVVWYAFSLLEPRLLQWSHLTTIMSNCIPFTHTHSI